jgi:O-antigen ligase
MTAASLSAPDSPPRLVTWAQNAAIFACCANFFSTALTSLGFAAFMVLFLCICISKERRHLDTRNFPVAVAVAIAMYVGWQLIGLSYTEAPMDHAWGSVSAERKILYVLPLMLVFSDEGSKEKFLMAFLLASVVGLVISFLVIDPFLHWRFTLNPDAVFRVNVTQSMIFALGGFLSLWFAFQYRELARRMVFFTLAAAFLLNIATLTPGRSGYVVCLVLTVWSFAMWRGFKGVLVGFLAAVLIGMVAFTVSPSVHDRVMKGVNEINTYSSSPEETSLGIRMVLYKTTWTIIKENPIFGTGTGGFKQRFSAIAAEKYSGWQAKPADDPHNQYLFVTVENGLIGLATFLFLLFTLVRQGLKGDSPYGKMAAGCVLAWSATSLFSGHFRTFPEGHLIAVVAGVLLANRPAKKA